MFNQPTAPNDEQKQKLMLAMMQGMQHKGGTQGGMATGANALAQALNGYMQGMNMQKMGAK